MQLPDEAIAYQYQSLLIPVADEWTPLAELRAKNYLSPARVKALSQQVMQIRSQVAAERELQQVPAEQRPLEPGFIDLPQRMLDQHRRKGDASDLGKVINKASRLRDLVDRVIILGAGGSYLGARALFESLVHTYHNELPGKSRLGVPRIYFEGNNADNDTIQDLLELLENNCVDPDLREERWGFVAISKSGGTLETLAAHRIFRNELTKFYGPSSELLKDVMVPVTAASGRLHDLFKSYGYTDDDMLIIPDNVGSRFSVCGPAGLLPAAIMGLDVRAFLLGAAAMTRRFLEESFERNPALQLAVVNYLMTEEVGKPLRIVALWSKKLETLGLWYDHLVSESLGKRGGGPNASDRGASARPAQPRSGVPGRPPRQHGHQCRVADAAHAADPDGHAGPQPGRPQLPEPQGIPRHRRGNAARHDPGLCGHRPAHCRDHHSSPERAHHGPDHADADAGHRRRRPPDGGQPLQPARRRGLQTPHETGVEEHLAFLSAYLEG